MDALQNTAIYGKQGGSTWVVSAGGIINIETGAVIQFNGVQPGPTGAIVDNTGGVATTTFAAIAAGAGYTQADMVAVKNALASIAAQYNAVLTILKNLGLST
jgi:hypothetical protein